MPSSIKMIMSLLLRLLLVAAASLMVILGGEAATSSDAYDPSNSKCQKSFRCSAHDIHYPFYLANESQSYCGYPGMAILCDVTSATATLRLAGNTSYTVLAIDYANHTITLADADVLASNSDCPRPRHNVTIPDYAWLNFTATGNSTISFFLNCNFTDSPPTELIPINCTGFGQSPAAPSFLAPELGAPDGEWFRACSEVYVVPVLREWLGFASPEFRPRLGSGGYGEVLSHGFRLSWNPSKGQCYGCEMNNGQCGYDQFDGFQGCLCPDSRVRQDCGGLEEICLQPCSMEHPYRRKRQRKNPRSGEVDGASSSGTSAGILGSWLILQKATGAELIITEDPRHVRDNAWRYTEEDLDKKLGGNSRKMMVGHLVRVSGL